MTRSRRDRWRFALKLASWPKLLVPMWLGLSLGITVAPNFSWLGVLFAVLFTLLDLVFIVLMNDWCDRAVDTLKRRMFPHESSPKTIPDGVLSAKQLAWGGICAAALALLLAAVTSVFWLGPALLGGSAACLLVFAGYSLPPLRLNYRGGGELLEMLGVGIALPWLSAFAVAGRVLFPELLALAPFAILSLASAIASGLSDEESDRAGGKRTVASVFGNRATRIATAGCLLIGGASWLVCALLKPDVVPPLAAVPAAAAVCWGGLRMRVHHARAVTNAFSAQSAYKLELHRAIWASGVLYGLLSIAGAWR